MGGLARATRACVAGVSHHEWLHDGVPEIRPRASSTTFGGRPPPKIVHPPTGGRSGGRRCCGVLGGVDRGVGRGAGASPGQILAEGVGFGVNDGEVGGFGHLAFGRGDQEGGLGLDRRPAVGVGTSGQDGGEQPQQRLDDGGLARPRSGGSGRRPARGARRTSGPGRDRDACRAGRGRRSGRAGGAASAENNTDRCSTAWIAVYGSLIAGDSALQAGRPAGACPGPGPARGCARTRSAPRRPAPRPKVSRRRDRGCVRATAGQIQASGVPATTCSPTRGRNRTCTRRAAAAAQQLLEVHDLHVPGRRRRDGHRRGRDGGQPSLGAGRQRRWITGSVLRSTTRMMWSTWSECARWSAKNTSSARLTNSSTTATVTANRGNSSLRCPPDTPTVEQPGRAVGEGADEHAEHDLVRAVAQEVAQQPRRELGRGQLQRHHGQARAAAR